MKNHLCDRCRCDGTWGWLPPLVLFGRDVNLLHLALWLVVLAVALFWLVMHFRRNAALRRTADEYRGLERQLKNILQHSREALFGYDLQQHHFDYLSPSSFSLTGFTAEELERMIPQNLLENVHPDDREEIGRLMEQLRQPSQEREWLGMVEYRFKHCDGQYRSFSDHLNMRYNEEGEPVYVSGYVRDVTPVAQLQDNLRVLEKRFQEAHKMAGLGLLASGIAHDFNNLMTVVLGNTELALMKHSDPDSRALDEIKKAALRASELANQMLVYSGKTELVLSSINLSTVVKEMGHLLDVSISKKVRMKYCLAEELNPIRGDISQIRQVAMNLITNAAEAIGGQAGVIAISIHELELKTGELEKAFPRGGIPPGNYVQLEVSDTGCGMDEKTIQKIFEPLFTTKITGRGLGLASVINVVQRHNGAIDVESHIGEGTVFRVYFPVEVQDSDTADEEEPVANGESWRGFGTALVADDEEAIRAIATALLERTGFNVVTAADGVETLEIFTKRDDITLLLMDLNMPQMDGDETVRRIRQINPTVPVLFMSGYPREQVMQKFEDHPHTDFIKKPFQAGELIDQVRGVIEQRMGGH